MLPLLMAIASICIHINDRHQSHLFSRISVVTLPNLHEFLQLYSCTSADVIPSHSDIQIYRIMFQLAVYVNKMTVGTASLH